MKRKTIILVLAGLGLTTALMAQKPYTPQDGTEDGWNPQGVHRQGMEKPRMHHRGIRHGHRMHRKDRRRRRMLLQRLTRALDLTPEQRREIRTVFRQERQAKQAARRIHRRHRKRRTPLLGTLPPETFMTTDRFDKEAFIKAVEKQAKKRHAEREAMRRKRLEQRAAFLEKIFKILTPEQRGKWLELGQEK